MGAPKLKLVTKDEQDDSRLVYVREDIGPSADFRKFTHQIVSTTLSTASGLIIMVVVLVGIVLGNLILAKIKPYLYPAPGASGPSALVGRELVTLRDINLRETPGTESSANIVGRCGHGTELQILEVNALENWYRVKITKKVTLKKHLPCLDEGWVYTENLKFTK